MSITVKACMGKCETVLEKDCLYYYTIRQYVADSNQVYITKMEEKKIQKYSVEHWRTALSPAEKKKLYLESIPGQVSASMAFEGEPVSLKMLKEYLKTLKARRTGNGHAW